MSEKKTDEMPFLFVSKIHHCNLLEEQQTPEKLSVFNMLINGKNFDILANRSSTSSLKLDNGVCNVYMDLISV